MGLLIDGVWKDQWYDMKNSGGEFLRGESVFRNWVTPDGSPGPLGEGGFRAEPGRYHLYVSLACPWAHRTLIFRKLKRLESAISVSVVDPFMGENGWAFTAPDGSLSSGSTRAIFLDRVIFTRFISARIRAFQGESLFPSYGT
jgi:glutathionyl-hydroquinone reductase